MNVVLPRAIPEVLPVVVCPYCQNPAKFFRSSAPMYGGRDFGPRYWCKPCDAHVGCHKGTVTPLGAPANKATRNARQAAHAAFDPLWLRHPSRGKWTRKDARQEEYRWLREAMGLAKAECHIGMFTVEQCARVVELCKARRP